MRTLLPVAGPVAVRRRARALALRHRRQLARATGLQLLATLAALVPARLLASLVGGIGHGLTRADVDRTGLELAAALAAAVVLTWRSRLAGAWLGETVLAELREDFVDGLLAMPLGTVERAGTGDLLTRTTADVEALSRTVRQAVPQLLVAVVTSVLVVAAMVVASAPAAAAALVCVPPLVLGTRWYLRRAPAGYLAERETSAAVNGRIAETVEAGRTVEALRRGRLRIHQVDADLAAAYAAERYTLRLRCVFFPVAETAYVLPAVATLVAGGLLVLAGHASLAAVTAVTLYAQQLVEPVDTLLSWLDEVQVGTASLARLLGVREVPADREPSGQEPCDEVVAADAVRFAYVPGRDVLGGVDLTLRAGERLAVVGPSGAGKSTLGRLLAGIHPPGAGRVTVGGADLVGLELERLRREVCLVTQEQHVFAGTLAENLRLAVPAARDAELLRALAAADALPWVQTLPDGLATRVGSGGTALRPAQVQQLALARLVLADPHTLVLDEATALLDPRAARHLERSLASVLAGRTVVAIAHRLHTASDADRVAVVEAGRIVELGTHDELLAADRAYAALWRSWHGGASPVDGPVAAEEPVGSSA